MKAYQPPASLPRILAILEDIVRSLREQDLDGSMRLEAKAVDLLRSRPLDAADRMILSRVIHRLRKISPGSSLTLGLEEALSLA